MARGGKRPGAGRKPGAVSEATRRRKEVAQKALSEGVSPLDVMLTTMRTLWDQATDEAGKVVNLGKAMQANIVAKDAAPFLHPKLSSVEAKVDARLIENIRASGQARIRAGAGDPDPEKSGRTSSLKKLKEDLEQFERITLRPLNIRLPTVDETVPLRIIADELRLIDQLARDAANGMTSAFGEAGRAMGDLLTIMTSYESRLAEIALAQKEGRLTEAQAIREQASAQINSYGDMAAAARGFFREGSDGYKAMLAVEQVYRAFQFASAVQAMALGGQETAFTLGQNAIRAASHGVVAVARALASLPFPLNLVAGAATIAALAAIGVKIAGGGGGSRGSSDDEGPDHSTNAVRSYTAQDAAARDQATSAIASKVEVRVTADREGMNAYVVGTAQREAVGVAAPMVAAAAAGTKRDVIQTLNDRQIGNRKVSV